MLIVNADDWGRSLEATDRILDCSRKGSVSSISAMLFMSDSERAAKLAIEEGIDVGLHVNFTEEFTGDEVSPGLRKDHDRIRRFLRASKYALLMYNPFLRKGFSAVFEAQREEFFRVYQKAPSHIDGHQHMHLCTNMILQEILPSNAAVRRSFSFAAGQKSVFNLTYRKWVDGRLAKRHRLTDHFFALSQHLPVGRLKPILDLARGKTVELMTHPEVKTEYDFLMSDECARALEETPCGNYSSAS